MAIERKDTDKLFDKIQEAIGSEKLANEMYAAMSTSFAYEILKYIARNYDLDYGTE